MGKITFFVIFILKKKWFRTIIFLNPRIYTTKNDVMVIATLVEVIILKIEDRVILNINRNVMIRVVLTKIIGLMYKYFRRTVPKG